MSVRRAQREIDASEFAEWVAFDQLEPFGPWRADYNAATIAAAILNATVRPKDPMRVSDFMPEFDYVPPTPSELAAKVHQVTSLFRQHG